jgi:hypothetical protein
MSDDEQISHILYIVAMEAEAKPFCDTLNLVSLC